MDKINAYYLKRIFPPLTADTLDNERKERKKKKRTHPITNYFPP
jgi:hypothetical protein